MTGGALRELLSQSPLWDARRPAVPSGREGRAAPPPGTGRAGQARHLGPPGAAARIGRSHRGGGAGGKARGTRGHGP
eukprot:1465448-Lingulodinium_polyedra.AAC.1